MLLSHAITPQNFTVIALLSRRCRCDVTRGMQVCLKTAKLFTVASSKWEGFRIQDNVKVMERVSAGNVR